MNNEDIKKLLSIWSIPTVANYKRNVIVGNYIKHSYTFCGLRFCLMYRRVTKWYHIQDKFELITVNILNGDESIFVHTTKSSNRSIHWHTDLSNLNIKFSKYVNIGQLK